MRTGIIKLPSVRTSSRKSTTTQTQTLDCIQNWYICWRLQLQVILFSISLFRLLTAVAGGCRQRIKLHIYVYDVHKIDLSWIERWNEARQRNRTKMMRWMAGQKWKKKTNCMCRQWWQWSNHKWRQGLFDIIETDKNDTHTEHFHRIGLAFAHGWKKYAFSFPYDEFAGNFRSDTIEAFAVNKITSWQAPSA